LELAFGLAILGAAMLLVVPVVVTRVAHRALRPLARFADEVANIDAQTLAIGLKAQADIPEELRPISAKLTDLLSRLQASFARERRFSADVAHELRTPLAELRTIAEVALRFPPDATPRTAAFQDVRDAAIQMERLIVGLRTLASAEDAGQSTNIETVDVAALAQKSWESFAEVARARGNVVSFETPSSAPAATDPALLGSVIRNLFSNAVEYTPAGGVIAWTVAVEPHAVVLSVRNANDNLRAEDLEHVFDPFWRKDAARTGGIHSGIGLSLAKAFTYLLSARLTLNLEAPDRVCAQLRLPTRL
jgi:two-component system sensor histidine kinase QseC